MHVLSIKKMSERTVHELKQLAHQFGASKNTSISFDGWLKIFDNLRQHFCQMLIAEDWQSARSKLKHPMVANKEFHWNQHLSFNLLSEAFQTQGNPPIWNQLWRSSPSDVRWISRRANNAKHFIVNLLRNSFRLWGWILRRNEKRPCKLLISRNRPTRQGKIHDLFLNHFECSLVAVLDLHYLLQPKRGSFINMLKC